MDIEYESVCTVRTSKGEETVPRRKMTKTHKSCHQRRWQPVMDVGGNLIHHRPITKLLPLILLLLLTRLQGKKKRKWNKTYTSFWFLQYRVIYNMYTARAAHRRRHIPCPLTDSKVFSFLFFSFLFLYELDRLDAFHLITSQRV